MESFDAKRNLERVAAGMKGSEYFQKLVGVPARTIVEGYPPEYAEKVMATSIPMSMPLDVWVTRYPNAKMK